MSLHWKGTTVQFISSIMFAGKKYPSREADLNHRPKDHCFNIANYSPPLYQLSYREWAGEGRVKRSTDHRSRLFLKFCKPDFR